MIDMFKYLQELIQMLTECKIRYFLTSGTLLGVVREGNFINGDLDIDIGIFLKELNTFHVSKFRPIIKNKGWTICRSGKDVITLRPIVTESFHIDIWLFRELQENYYFHYGWTGKFIWSKELIDPLRTISWNNKLIYIPSQPEKYLETLYGTNWRVPQNIIKPQGFANYKEDRKC